MKLQVAHFVKIINQYCCQKKRRKKEFQGTWKAAPWNNAVAQNKLHKIMQHSDLSVNTIHIPVVPYHSSNCTLSLRVSWTLFYWRDLAKHISKGSKPINACFELSKYLSKFASPPFLSITVLF